MQRFSRSRDRRSTAEPHPEPARFSFDPLTSDYSHRRRGNSQSTKLSKNTSNSSVHYGAPLEEDFIGLEFKRRSSKNSSTAVMRELIDREMSRQSSPSLVAQLMGLDSSLTSFSPHRPRPRSCRKNPSKFQEFKDIFEVTEKLKVDKSYCTQKERREALEDLCSYEDSFLDFLQETNPLFKMHLEDLKSSPECTHGSNITILKPLRRTKSEINEVHRVSEKRAQIVILKPSKNSKSERERQKISDSLEVMGYNLRSARKLARKITEEMRSIGSGDKSLDVSSIKNSRTSTESSLSRKAREHISQRLKTSQIQEVGPVDRRSRTLKEIFASSDQTLSWKRRSYLDNSHNESSNYHAERATSLERFKHCHNDFQVHSGKEEIQMSEREIHVSSESLRDRIHRRCSQELVASKCVSLHDWKGLMEKEKSIKHPKVCSYQDVALDSTFSLSFENVDQSEDDQKESIDAHSDDLDVQVSSIADNEEENYSLEKFEELIKEFRSDEDRDFSYLLDLLTESGINNAGPEHSVEPEIFEKLENKYNALVSWSRQERKLFFDLIVSILVDMRPIYNTENFLEKVWQIVVKRRKEATNCELDEQVLDSRWLNLARDVDVIVEEFERMIIEDLIEELCC